MTYHPTPSETLVAYVDYAHITVAVYVERSGHAIGVVTDENGGEAIDQYPNVEAALADFVEFLSGSDGMFPIDNIVEVAAGTF